MLWDKDIKDTLKYMEPDYKNYFEQWINVFKYHIWMQKKKKSERLKCCLFNVFSFFIDQTYAQAGGYLW